MAAVEGMAIAVNKRLSTYDSGHLLGQSDGRCSVTAVGILLSQEQ